MTKMQTLNAGLIGLTAAAMLLVAQPSAAQGLACGPRTTVLERLASRFGETRRGVGLSGRGDSVIEVFASDATGSWTVTVTLPDGRTCLLASGRDWEDRMDDLAHLADAEA
jgi:hypothetical protein